MSAHAACEREHRVAAEKTPCLESSYNNKGDIWNQFKGSEAKARNKCSQYGKMVVKVDRVWGEDWTWHLSNGEERKKSGSGTIDSITCCRDLSDKGLCGIDPFSE